MNICTQLINSALIINTVLTLGFVMLALTRLGKKNREEAAYTASIGLILVVFLTSILPSIPHTIMNLINIAENTCMGALWNGLVYSIIATILLMLVGEYCKVKAVQPKILLLCFAVGMVAANLTTLVIAKQCATPKVVKHRG